MRTFTRIVALVLGACTAAGCGYSFEPLVRSGVRSLQVPLFENDTRRRELEFSMTDAVARELRKAGYRIASPGGADAILFGRITEVAETVLSEDPSGSSAQGRLTVAVEFRLVNSGDKAVLASGRVSEGGEAVFARGEDRPAGLDRAVAELARALVRALEPPPPD